MSPEIDYPVKRRHDRRVPDSGRASIRVFGEGRTQDGRVLDISDFPRPD